jgi:hypothetical protein
MNDAGKYSNINLLKGTNLFFEFSKSVHPQSTERKEGGGQRVTEKTATSGRPSLETFLTPCVYTIKDDICRLKMGNWGENLYVREASVQCTS